MTSLSRRSLYMVGSTHGRKYTWSNLQNSPTLAKLDWVLCSVDWEDLFPNCLLQSMASDDSDHRPLLLGLCDNKAGRRRFHFESFWPMLEGFQETVAAAWASVPAGPCPFATVDLKFKTTTKGLQSWSEKDSRQCKFTARPCQGDIAPIRDCPK